MGSAAAAVVTVAAAASHLAPTKTSENVTSWSDPLDGYVTFRWSILRPLPGPGLDLETE